MRLKFLTSLSILSLATWSSAINNPGFEAPIVATNSFEFRPTGNLWAMTARAGICNGNGNFAGSPHSGNQYAFMIVDAGGTTTMTQRFTGLVVGHLYKIRYWQARVTSPSSQVAVLIDDVELAGGSVAVAQSGWSAHETPCFRATATSHLVKFRAKLYTTLGSISAIDDVSIEETTDTLADLNGSFESPILPNGSWNYGCTGEGSKWHFSEQTGGGGVGAGIATINSPWGPSAADGNQFAFIQNNGYMERMLRGLRIGQPYKIKLKIRAAGSAQVQVTLNGIPLRTLVTGSTGDWLSEELPIFIADATSANLKFQGLQTSGGSMEFDAVQVVPVDFSEFTIAPSGIVCGNEALGTVTISDVATVGGATIDLLSLSSLVKVPASVIIPEGSTSASFPITSGVTAVTTMKQVQARYGRLQKTRNLVVMPAMLSGITLSPTSIIGGSDAVGTVFANGTAYVGFSISLTSSGPQLVVPSSVTIPYNRKQATFTANSLPAMVTYTEFVTATRGSRSRTATILITP